MTIALMVLFAVSLLGQLLTGWRVENEDLARHGGSAVTLGSYMGGPAFLSTVFENWESEFLQMATYVLLTAILIQRGSAESKDPEDPPRDQDLRLKGMAPQAPPILHKGRLARAIYSRSLGIALTLLFLVSFTIHWTQSARVAAQEAIDHHEVPPTLLGYLVDPQLWFESFQNWQSEFLSTAVLVVLTIFLRQRESPESKPVAAPHSQTGA
nr:DUF6766 family protein [Sphingomonas solaris]